MIQFDFVFVLNYRLLVFKVALPVGNYIRGLCGVRIHFILIYILVHKYETLEEQQEVFIMFM